MEQLLAGLAGFEDQQLLEALELESVGLSVGLDDILAVLAAPEQFEDELEVELNPEEGDTGELLLERRVTLILRMMQSLCSSARTSSYFSPSICS